MSMLGAGGAESIACREGIEPPPLWILALCICKHTNIHTYYKQTDSEYYGSGIEHENV